MYRYFLKLAYNGADFHGWQVQDNAHSVQAEITDKLKLMLKEDLHIVGCGRTDTGVHASMFYAHFDINSEIRNVKDFIYKLNSFLSRSIVIYDLFKVDNEMHARFDAKSRTYKYYISPLKNPFKDEFSYQYFPKLDVDAMNQAAEKLFEYTDFTSFSKLHTQTNTNNCRIAHAKWEYENEMLVFTITADRFLRNMVRAIVGTLLEVGNLKMSTAEFQKVIELKDRSKAGFSVPAKGLFLHDIRY
ncbi:MAG: tRNA pseudouridine(38-40) synthase TruA [Marinilabiliales bacterium]|nr:MAG: tRNA pseudouridine(38-40) synthase TruA [Marinilabiliales bacterium]